MNAAVGMLVMVAGAVGGMGDPHPRVPAPAPVAAAPRAIVIATTRGESVVPVTTSRGHPALAAPALSALLPVTSKVREGWADVAFAGEPFRFLLDAPLVILRGRVVPLVGGAYLSRDTLFVPLEWLTEHIPRMFREGYRYDAPAGRFEEARLQPVLTRTTPATPPPEPALRPPSARARRSGFRAQHKVVIDPGHGGVDRGNPGLFLPRGVQEKHVTLAISKLLRDELVQRGVEVVMTRTTDRQVNLTDRAPMCRDDCDLFVSIHVNSLRRRPGYQSVSGFETYFLGDQVTADAERVARMENEALRYETSHATDPEDPLNFILKDLHTNAYLRESMQLAEAVQRNAAKRHPGGDRGVAQAGFVVLKAASRPAVLVETGFATNRRDASYLASQSGQRELARAIAAGIVAYLVQYENRVLPDG
ncbi:MAG: N-acetylmuramoyl-L-alanine amidase [Gemmatimonadales bacterium]